MTASIRKRPVGAFSQEWWETQAKRHELYISAEVVAELSAPDFLNSDRAIEMLRGLSALPLTPEVGNLAELLVENKVMPGPANRGDALHVAVATIHSMDYILTWNVKHLANPNKRTHFAIICMRLGLMAPMLITPDMLQSSDEASDGH